MGLRMGDDHTYKFHPPVPSERSRPRLRPSKRRKDLIKDDEDSDAKPPISTYKGLMFHVRSGANSAQTANYSSLQVTPRPSLGARPASQASFTPSIASRHGEEQPKKWWSGRSRKVKQSMSKQGLFTSELSSRSPITEPLRTVENLVERQKDVRGMHNPLQLSSILCKSNLFEDDPDMQISQPYNFQHHMHVQPHQFRGLANKNQNDLIAEFSAMRAAQSATRQAHRPNGVQQSSRSSCAGAIHSLPASFQATARTSMQVPEPASPRSDKGVRHIETKGSFSVPFRDGKSPKLQQKSSTELLSMPVTESRLLDNHQIDMNNQMATRTESHSCSTCTHCASRAVSLDGATELDASPTTPNVTRVDDSISTVTVEGLKTGYWPSPSEREGCDFKALSSMKKSREAATHPHPQPHLPGSPSFLQEVEEMRASMNRSSVTGGLFSSWAADDDSSEDGDEAPARVPAPLRVPKQKNRNRLLLKALHNSKGLGTYTAPAKPPPDCPLPQVPNTPSFEVKQDSGTSIRCESINIAKPAVGGTDNREDACDDNVVRVADSTPNNAFANRPNSKTVRFDVEERFTRDRVSTQLPSNTSMGRVQATLDDLRSDISRLEIDLSCPSPDSDGLELERPKTAGCKDSSPSVSQQRHRALSSPRPASRSELQGSQIPRPAHKVARSSSLVRKFGADLPEIPRFIASTVPTDEPKTVRRSHERTFSNSSATIPGTVLPTPVAVQ